MSSLISIIVPIYKVEQYLDRCIQSIVRQTYQNLEIILVDDGSPDNCSQICDEWAKIDSRIKVIHKENGGLSDARNAGMQIATGEWIGFVDSDDWIHPRMYEKLHETMENKEADISVCQFVKRTDINEKDFEVGTNTVHEVVYQTEAALKELILDRAVKQVVWNKLYRRDVLQDIYFEVGKYNEDEFWSYQVIANAKKITTIDFIGYFYFQRTDSIIGEKYSLRRLDGLEGKERRLEFIKKNYPTLESVARLNLFYSLCYAYQCCLRCLEQEEMNIAKNIIYNMLERNSIKQLDYKNETVKQKIWIIMYRSSLEMTCRLRNALKIGL